MTQTDKSATKFSDRFAVLAAVAALTSGSAALAGWAEADARNAGTQAGFVNQGIQVTRAGEDAIFGNSFEPSPLKFALADPQPNLVDVWAGSFASGDVDGDGDMDLVMSGITPVRQAKLYLNDGSGNFSEVASPLPPASSGQAILKDLDGDGDLDAFFSGNGSLSNFTHIYRNNGSGIFARVANDALPIIMRGADIADVDHDGDQDIVISSGGVADVYLNNGNAVFSPKGSSVFAPVDGVVRFIDVDNDGGQDVIISGRAANNVPSTKLYRNDGFGNFTAVANSIFADIRGEDIDVADTDRDGDLDVLLNGNTRNLLYINSGSGIFTEVATGLQQTFGGQNEFADLDNDGDQDLLIVGTQAGGLPNIYNIVYENRGNNLFAQAAVLGGEYIAACAIEDFTGDGLKDVVVQGFVDQTNVYWNTSVNSN